MTSVDLGQQLARLLRLSRRLRGRVPRRGGSSAEVPASGMRRPCGGRRSRPRPSLGRRRTVGQRRRRRQRQRAASTAPAPGCSTPQAASTSDLHISTQEAHTAFVRRHLLLVARLLGVVGIAAPVGRWAALRWRRRHRRTASAVPLLLLLLPQLPMQACRPGATGVSAPPFGQGALAAAALAVEQPAPRRRLPPFHLPPPQRRRLPPPHLHISTQGGLTLSRASSETTPSAHCAAAAAARAGQERQVLQVGASNSNPVAIQSTAKEPALAGAQAASHIPEEQLPPPPSPLGLRSFWPRRATGRGRRIGARRSTPGGEGTCDPGRSCSSDMATEGWAGFRVFIQAMQGPWTPQLKPSSGAAHCRKL